MDASKLQIPAEEKQMNEALLAAWLRLSAVLRNERFMQGDFSYNEATICGLLEQRRQKYPEEPHLSIRAVCDRTKILKSQANKLITGLEARGVIRRFRLGGDRRFVYVALTEEGRALYGKEHARVLEIVDRVIAVIGEGEASASIAALTTLTKAVRQIQGDL